MLLRCGVVGATLRDMPIGNGAHDWMVLACLMTCILASGFSFTGGEGTVRLGALVALCYLLLSCFIRAQKWHAATPPVHQAPLGYPRKHSPFPYDAKYKRSWTYKRARLTMPVETGYCR